RRPALLGRPRRALRGREVEPGDDVVVAALVERVAPRPAAGDAPEGIIVLTVADELDAVREIDAVERVLADRDRADALFVDAARPLERRVLPRLGDRARRGRVAVLEVVALLEVAADQHPEEEDSDPGAERELPPVGVPERGRALACLADR